jgi:hypothetical protein
MDSPEVSGIHRRCATKEVRRGWYRYWIEKLGRGGPPRRLVATGVSKKSNRESREITPKEDEEF